MNKRFFAAHSIPRIYSSAWITFLKTTTPRHQKQIYDQAHQLTRVFAQFPDLLAQLSRSSPATAKNFLDETMSSWLDSRWINFFFVLVDDHQLSSLSAILPSTIDQLAAILKIESGEIYTVTPLPKATIEKIATKIGRLRQTSISLTNKIDHQLLAGVRVEINNTVWDNTIKKQLTNLRTELLAE